MALLDQIIGVESGGDPNARNPRSSAGGLGQFIDRTWVEMLQKHRPDIAQSMSPQGLLALKSDPALSREMTEAYAKDNGAVLSGAGLPVTPGTTYLAHFAGPQGAVSVLQADPSTPIDRILRPDALAANPFLKGMTAADLRAWADRKMGGPAQAPAPKAAPVSPASPPAAMPTPSFAGLSAPAAQAAPQFAPAAAPDIAPAEPLAPLQIAFPQRKPPDLRALRSALARPSAGVFFGRG